jgi:membrane protease YdiL (CAAX protease family)
VIRAAVISSFFFAEPHLLNTIGGIWDPYFAIVDSVAAFGLGITFAALRVRTGSIWPLIGIHALFDFTSLITLGGFSVPSQSSQVLITSVIIGIVFLIYGLFLLRGSKINVPEQVTA